jgi:hypothetical protein
VTAVAATLMLLLVQLATSALAQPGPREDYRARPGEQERREDRFNQERDSFNLTGTWICREICPAGGAGRLASIAQNGRQLTFTNEGGQVSGGYFDGPATVIATQWNNTRANVADGGREIRWANGTIWVRRESRGAADPR